MKLVDKISELIGEHETNIQSSSNILDIGLNSIDFIKILVFAEDEFGIEFDDGDLLMKKYQVIEDVVDLICSYMIKEKS